MDSASSWEAPSHEPGRPSGAGSSEIQRKGIAQLLVLLSLLTLPSKGGSESSVMENVLVLVFIGFIFNPRTCEYPEGPDQILRPRLPTTVSLRVSNTHRRLLLP